MSYFKNHVFFCCNQRQNGDACCNDHGANDVRDYAKKRVKELGLSGEGKVRINQAGCLDRCELGADMVIYPDGVWYHYENETDIDEILTTHIKGGGRVTRLMLKPGDDPPKAKE